MDNSEMKRQRTDNVSNGEFRIILYSGKEV